MYSLRTRSGSVGREPAPSTYRGSSSFRSDNSYSSYRPDPSPYRTSYGNRDTSSGYRSSQPTSRLSRASSYDPFASRTSGLGSSYSRPSNSSLSHSYHSEYSPRSLTNRYGSTDQLSSYRTPTTSSRPPIPESGGSRYSVRSSSTFSRNSSVSDRSYSRELPSSSLAKYRPDAPTGLLRSSTATFIPRVTFDYRSKTPGVSSSSESSKTRIERDCKSMTRFDKTPTKEEKEEDEVESTFRKLYDRYVKETSSEVESPNSDKPATRKFISHSEAEDPSEEELSADEIDDSFAEVLRSRKSSMIAPTQRDLTPSDLTPTASPLPAKKLSITSAIKPPPEAPKARIEEIPRKDATIVVKSSTPEKSAAEAFKEDFQKKHGDVEMTPVVIPTRALKPAASAMDKVLMRDTLTTKLAEAIEKKKVVEEKEKKKESNGSSTEVVKQTSNIPKASTPKLTVSATLNSATKPPVDAKKSSSSSSAQPVVQTVASSVSNKEVTKSSNVPSKGETKKTDPTTPVIIEVKSNPKEKGEPKAGEAVKLKLEAAKAIPNSNTSNSKIVEGKIDTKITRRSASPGPKKKVEKAKSVTPKIEIEAAKEVDKKEIRADSSSKTEMKTAPKSKSTTPIPSKPEPEKKTEPTVSVAAKISSELDGTLKTENHAKSTSPAPSPNKAESSLKARSSSPARKAASKTKAAEQTLEINKTSLAKPELPKSPKSVSPAPIGKSKPQLTIDTKKAEEPMTEVTIVVSKSMRSRSSSPAGRKSRSRSRDPAVPQLLTVDGANKGRSASPAKLLTPDADREERAKSLTNSIIGNKINRRRDPKRTLDAMLKEVSEKQQKEQRESEEKEEKPSTEENKTPAIKPPLLLVTHPSVPSTPMTPGSDAVWSSSTDENDWTEAEDEAEYESDNEFTISQTFKIPDKHNTYVLPPGSSRASPFVSDYDSDCSLPFLTANQPEDSRGRVHRLFAVPPPTFTCSISYDGQESWDSDSVHTCDEDDFDDVYTAPRPGSSSLGAYLSPAGYSSDENYSASEYHDDVQVGCTLKLVDRAALKDSDETDSEYYEYSDAEDEEYWDEEYEEEEYEEEEEYYEEEIEEEVEELEDDDDDQMHSIIEDKSLSPLPIITASINEEEVDVEEMDGDFEVSEYFEIAEPKEVVEGRKEAKKFREITYTKDQMLLAEEEKANQLEIEEEEKAKAIAKRIKKDPASSKAEKTIVPQLVAPVEERISEAMAEQIEADEVLELSAVEVNEIKDTNEINVVPTFVRPLTEKVKEESTSRFTDRKPTTDFAKKAVIQPTKLETAKVQKIETKIGEPPKPKEPTVNKENQMATEAKSSKAEPLQTSAVPSTSPAKKEAEIKKTPVQQTKQLEDKSSVRKSALNMSAEDAQKKAKADEEAARQKARRFGTVSALMDRFKDVPKEEPIVYKRSSRLQPKDEDERPKRKYEIVKPVINDEFDKQMQEIRAQMKAGKTLLESEMKTLAKGINLTAEEAKKRELEEQHKTILGQASDIFSKADVEKSRWKEKRDAETEKELAKIEADKGKRKPKKIEPEPKVEEPPKEKRRTIRRINREKPAEAATDAATNSASKSSTAAATVAPETQKKQSTEPTNAAPAKPPAAPVSQQKSVVPPKAPPPPATPSTDASPGGITRMTRERTPVVKPADTIQKPIVPAAPAVVVDENNFDLLTAATKVATRRRKSLLAEKEKKEKEISEPKPASPSPSKPAPKSEGAVATKIRNALGNATNEQSPAGSERSTKRYSSRRKTQELVNASPALPTKRRKERQRKNRFIRKPYDIDVLLGWEKQNTFELMEQMFTKAASDRISAEVPAKKRRVDHTRVWISDLTDIDKIYKSSEIRDIIASVGEP